MNWLIILWFLTVPAMADYHVGANVHLKTEIDMAIFHNASSAKVWADMYQGRIEVKSNDTYIVWYPVTVAESTPSDWNDNAK